MLPLISDWSRGVFAWKYVNMVVTSRCFTFRALITQERIWTFSSPEPLGLICNRTVTGDQKKQRALGTSMKKVLSWKLDKFSSFTHFVVSRHSKSLNKHAALIFLLKLTTVSAKNPYFGKHPLKHFPQRPLKGCGNFSIVTQSSLRLGFA